MLQPEMIAKVRSSAAERVLGSAGIVCCCVFFSAGSSRKHAWSQFWHVCFSWRARCPVSYAPIKLGTHLVGADRRSEDGSLSRGAHCAARSLCAVVARIRFLRKSSQYLMVSLQGKITVSAKLRDSPRNFCNNRAEEYHNSWLAKFPNSDSEILSSRVPGTPPHMLPHVATCWST